MSDDKSIGEDMAWLMGQPQFRRLCWRVIQMSGLFSATNGTDERTHVSLGRRQLGLEFLAECEKGQPAQSSDGTPILTMIQVLREEAQQQPKEPRNAKHYNRSDEIAEPEDDAN